MKKIYVSPIAFMNELKAIDIITTSGNQNIPGREEQDINQPYKEDLNWVFPV